MKFFCNTMLFIDQMRRWKVETMIEGQDIISMIDRDFNIIYEQYEIRSTEKFGKYYNLASS